VIRYEQYGRIVSIQLTLLPYFPYLHYSTYFSSIFSISFHTLGGGRYAELTEWNGTKRVDLRFWETDTIPTKYGEMENMEEK
jgi:hypothetical protein